MTETLVTGPSGTAGWEERVVEVASGPSYALRLLPAAASEAMAATERPQHFYYLPATPALAHTTEGDPVFSLTLLLSRRPAPDEENIQPLIEQGVLSMDVSLAVPAAVLTALDCEPQVDYHPLFARDASFALVWDEAGMANTLATAQASGADVRAALSATLNRPITLAVLAALDGTPGPLQLKSEIVFRTSATAQTIRLTGSWAAIYDFVVARTTASLITRIELRRAFDDMLAARVISAYRMAGGHEERLTYPDPAPLFAMFLRLSSIILQREGPDGYSLHGRPHEMFRLNYQETVAGDGQRSVTLDAPLHEVIGGALAGRDWDRFVRLVSPNPGGGGVEPVSRRMPWVRGSERWHDSAAGNGSSNRFAAIGGQVKSVSLAALPASHATSTINAGTSGSSLPGSTINIRPIDGLELELPSARPRPQSLPVVDNPKAPLWRDRITANKHWYAPEFEVVQPASNAAPDASPFLFTYERTGVTGAGEPALAATVRFTLRKRMSDATVAAAEKLGGPVPRSEVARTGVWAGFPQFVRVPTEQLAVTLLIPFVDEKDGRVKLNPCSANAVEDHGDTVTVTVRLRNDWVRLCYGALAEAGFQQRPASLRLDYSFASYVRVRGGTVTLAYGGKLLGTSVVYARDDVRRSNGAFFDAASLTYHQPSLEVRFAREPRQDSHERRPPIGHPTGPIIGGPTGPIIDRPTGPVVVKPRPKPPVKPDIDVSPDLADEIRKVQYATKRQARQHQTAVLFPCNRLGNFYREENNGHSTAIGCRDALQLGQIAYRQYEEIEALRTDAYRVYRSLAQPDQFLVAPTNYCISRQLASAETDAYRPLIVLYASLDPEEAVNSRVNLDVTLQPDLPPHLRRDLVRRLATYSQHPRLQYPTEIATEQVQDTWLLDSEVTVQLQPAGPFLLAMFETDLPGWQVLLSRLEHAGVTGAIDFTLADETHIQANLSLRLAAIRGPWDAGPVAVEHTNGTVRLTNYIEQRVNVHNLALYGGTDAADRIPVEQSLAAGESHPVALSGDPAEIYPIYSVAPAGPTAITEIRSFVENIFQTITFVNLINFANHSLERLEVTARIKGMAGSYAAQLSEAMPTAAIELILPLTTYLERHTLQYQVTKVSTAGQRATTDWFDEDLNASAIISLTWDSVQ